MAGCNEGLLVFSEISRGSAREGPTYPRCVAAKAYHITAFVLVGFVFRQLETLIRRLSNVAGSQLAVLDAVDSLITLYMF